MAAKKDKFIQTIVKNGVLAWSYIYKPDDTAPEGAAWKPDGKYKTQTVYEPGGLDALDALIRKEATEKFGTVDFDSFRFPFTLHDEEAKTEGFRNKLVLKAGTKNKPEVVDAKRQPVPAKVKLYSGDIVNLLVSLYFWEKDEEETIVEGGKKKKVKVKARGCSLRLAKIQLIEKRGGSSADGFDEEEGFVADAAAGEDYDAPAGGEDGNGDF